MGSVWQSMKKMARTMCILSCTQSHNRHIQIKLQQCGHFSAHKLLQISKYIVLGQSFWFTMLYMDIDTNVILITCIVILICLYLLCKKYFTDTCIWNVILCICSSAMKCLYMYILSIWNVCICSLDRKCLYTYLVYICDVFQDLYLYKFCMYCQKAMFCRLANKIWTLNFINFLIKLCTSLW